MEFDIKVKTMDMFHFNMYQAYTTMEGWLAIIMAVIAFVVAKVTYGRVETPYTVVYVVFGIILLFYVPVALLIRAKCTIASNLVLQDTLHYLVDDNGFTVSQKGSTGELPWIKVYKLVFTKHNVLIYNSRMTAYVVPVDQLAEGQKEELMKIVYKHLPGFRVIRTRK